MRGYTWDTITTDINKPGDWGFVFETPNLRDMVAQAQARFLNAQADMMGVEQETLTGDADAGKSAPYSVKKKTATADCGCHVVKEQRPVNWPEVDKLETDYENRLKADWAELEEKVTTILGLDQYAEAVADKGITRDSFTFSTDERAMVMAALKNFLGEYTPSAEDSAVNWYYGQSYSAGLIQAADLIGKGRPVLDLIKNREIYQTLTHEGFDLVKNNATRQIKDKILAEMEAQAIAGSNPRHVAARLKKLFGKANSNWERLARSEMTMAAEKAKLAEWKAWDVQNITYRPGPDACPLCQSLAGDYPIDQSPVPVRDTHPHCRCSISVAKSEYDTPKMDMPAPTYAGTEKLLPKGKDETFYLEAFMAAFGAQIGESVTFTDVTGTALEISDELFRDNKGALKIFKRGRETHVLLLADTIKDPDEIWGTEPPAEGLNPRRRYIARVLLEGNDRPMLVVFEETDAGWQGVTAFPPDESDYERLREGEMVWKRE